MTLTPVHILSSRHEPPQLKQWLDREWTVISTLDQPHFVASLQWFLIADFEAKTFLLAAIESHPRTYLGILDVE